MKAMKFMRRPMFMTPTTFIWTCLNSLTCTSENWCSTIKRKKTVAFLISIEPLIVWMLYNWSWTLRKLSIIWNIWPAKRITTSKNYPWSALTKDVSNRCLSVLYVKQKSIQNMKLRESRSTSSLSCMLKTLKELFWMMFTNYNKWKQTLSIESLL